MVVLVHCRKMESVVTDNVVVSFLLRRSSNCCQPAVAGGCTSKKSKLEARSKFQIPDTIGAASAVGHSWRAAVGKTEQSRHVCLRRMVAQASQGEKTAIVGSRRGK